MVMSPHVVMLPRRAHTDPACLVVRTVYQIGEQLRCELTKMVEETLVKKNVAECVKMVEDCVLQPHLLSVYELESDCGGDSAGGVDVALLRALLKGHFIHL